MNPAFVLLFIATFSSTFTSPLDTKINCVQPKYRLSGDVKPSFYSIKIKPDLNKETFVGEVLIHVKVEASAEAIEFHSANLNINHVYFNSKEARYIPEVGDCNLSWDELGYEFLEHQLIRIKYGNRNLVPPGAHVIHIKYDGTFSETTEGMFKTGFTKNGTLLSYLVATDFEPHFARQVFPCFDEPAFKAKFQLNVVVPDKTYTAISNMRVMEKFETSNGVFYKFEMTPPMSTYLLSFVISQHTYKEYVDGIPYRVYSFNGSQENNTRFLEFSSKTIKFYENYTTINYTLPKIDFVGFDRNESSATENWGLVTFNSSLLSPDDDVYDDSQKLTVIAHELAHFWFGNLVTNDWWDGIWLQEGLATFMSIKAEEHILRNSASKDFPQLYMENLFWTERMKNTTPVINFQVLPSKVRANFNDITYNKAAVILRMLESVIGEEIFRKAIIKYINKFAFKTASSDDFLSVVGTCMADVDLREFMETFLYQSKYPILAVNEDGDNFVLKQQSCCPSQDEGSSLGYRWTIPVTYTTDLNKNPSTAWFYKDMEYLSLPKNNAKWIKFNYQQIGYYRVNYSVRSWETFMENIQEMEPYERNVLVLEAADLFVMDLVSCDVVLKYIFKLACDPTFFNTQHQFLAYAKLNDKLNSYDKEASRLLKNFFARIFTLAKKKRYANYFEKNQGSSILNETNKLNVNVPLQTQSCIDWLKFESREYLSNHTVTSNGTYVCH